MQSLSMRFIEHSGDIKTQDDRKTVYLTPSEPLTYYTNQWVYHQMPTLEEWLEDAQTQLKQHHQQDSHHLAFTFPEDTPLPQDFKDYFKAEGFEVGVLEMYAIEAADLQAQIPSHLDIKWVDLYHLEDYLKICRYFSQQYGQDYADEMVKTLKQQFGEQHNVKRVIAYQEGQPIGTLDLIESNQTVEIDSFGVLKTYRGQGVGRAMQAFAAQYAKDKTIVLLADGDDTAKDMYVKQGYTYISYCYNVLKEHI